VTIQPALTLLLLVMALGGFCYAFWQLQRSRVLIRILNSQRIAANSALQRSRMDIYSVRNRAKLLEDTVSGGASAVDKAKNQFFLMRLRVTSTVTVNDSHSAARARPSALAR